MAYSSVLGINCDLKVTLVATLDWMPWRIFPFPLLISLYVVITFLVAFIRYMTGSNIREKKNLTLAHSLKHVHHGSRNVWQGLLAFWLARRWKDWSEMGPTVTYGSSLSPVTHLLQWGSQVPKMAILAENRTHKPRTNILYSNRNNVNMS